MKKLKKLKLSSISQNILDEKQKHFIRGGAGSCGCACAYADHGGSSKQDNDSANDEYDLTSPGYEDEDCGGAWWTEEYEGEIIQEWKEYSKK